MDFRGQQDLNKNELQNYAVHKGPSFPVVTPSVGQLFFNTGDSGLYIGKSGGGSIYWHNVIQGTVSSIDSGIITYWGRSGYVPSGWALCDGSSGTPNMLDMFIKGYSATGFGASAGTGHSHSLAHAHSYNFTTGAANVGVGNVGVGTPQITCAYMDPAHTHGVSGSSLFPSTDYTTGASNELPPYMTLKPIMKL